MNIPTIPTDNLYKFLSLSGISAAVVLIVSFQFSQNDIQIKVAELSGLMRLLENQTSRFNEMNKNFDHIHIDEMAELERHKKDFNQREENIIKLQNEIEKQLEIVRALQAQFNSLKEIYFILIPTFIFQSILGFILWYHKLQKYQDVILKNKATLTLPT